MRKLIATLLLALAALPSMAGVVLSEPDLPGLIWDDEADE